MGGRVLICSGEEKGGWVLKVRMIPDLHTGVCSPCQSSMRSQWSHSALLEAGSAPQRRLQHWERWEVGRLEESRRCKAADERASGAAVADDEECRTPRLSWRDCLMCSPANNSSIAESK